MSDPIEEPEELDCPICGGLMLWESCWHCLGDGGFHDCGEDHCCCLDEDEIDFICEECGGKGSYLQCQSLPHTDEQLAHTKGRET